MTSAASPDVAPQPAHTPPQAQLLAPSARCSFGSVHHPDKIAVHVTDILAQILTLHAASIWCVRPAVAILKPASQISPAFSVVRCTVSVPGHLSSGVAISIKTELSKPFRSGGVAAINKDDNPKIWGFVATSSRTAGGGTFSVVKHLYQSHPIFFESFLTLLDREMPPHAKCRTRRPFISPTTAAPTIPARPTSVSTPHVSISENQ